MDALSLGYDYIFAFSLLSFLHSASAELMGFFYLNLSHL